MNQSVGKVVEVSDVLSPRSDAVSDPSLESHSQVVTYARFTPVPIKEQGLVAFSISAMTELFGTRNQREDREKSHPGHTGPRPRRS